MTTTLLPPTHAPALGAVPLDDRVTEFCVWAPHADRVDVLLDGAGRPHPLEPANDGYFVGRAQAPPGTRYRYRLHRGPTAMDRPDPASRHQPDGVHGPSAVVDPSHDWHDADWDGIRLEDHVLYEIHVGTATREGTFDALIPRLDDLARLGVTTLELMPIAEFPGSRNWGYDGVHAYAAQSTYGGPHGLRRLVDACHARGLAVVLDVVHNHLGPEGNVLADFGPYTSTRAHTPWGPAVNFDGPDNGPVRRHFIENALAWIRECHVDGFRLDAVHAIVDTSPIPFLHDLSDAVHGLARSEGRPVHLFAESDDNDPRLARDPARGGIGLDAAWSDDVHHALHVCLTGERNGYYQDYAGAPDLARALEQGFAFTGQTSAFRRRRRGAPADDLEPWRFVAFAQNHDQVGNRAGGERLISLCGPEGAKAASAAICLGPHLPLLFMGEEYGEDAPFHFFTSHSDPALVEAVRAGRRHEFAAWGWPRDAPDPQSIEAFERSRIEPAKASGSPHRQIQAWHAHLLAARRRLALGRVPRSAMTVWSATDPAVVAIERATTPRSLLVVHLGARAAHVRVPAAPGTWAATADSADRAWGGPGSRVPARSLVRDALLLDLQPRHAVLFEAAEVGA